MSYLFVTGELAVEYQPFDVLELLSLRMGCLLASLNTKDSLSHDLKLLPIDSRFIFTDEGLVSFFCRDQIAAVQWQERNPLRE